MSISILETKDLSIGYVKKGVANIVSSRIDLNFRPGKLISIIGANGIGKSTLVRTISGLQRKISGKILIGGQEISAIKPPDLARYLSLVLTDRLPAGNMTVRELISIGRQPYTNWIGSLTPSDHLKIDEAFAMTNIGHIADKKFYEISDGQLQTVMIARALAQDTPMIILDEPSTHLDLLHKLSLFRLLTNLAHQYGKTIVFSTHDIEIALQVCDEVIVMTEENVVQESIETFISNKSFDRVFSGSGISFDAETMKVNFDALNR